MKKELLHLAGTLCAAFALATPAFAGMAPVTPDSPNGNAGTAPTTATVAAADEAAYTPAQQKILSCVQEAMKPDGVVKVTNMLDPPGSLPARTPFTSVFMAEVGGGGMGQIVNLSASRATGNPKNLTFNVLVRDGVQEGFAKGVISYQDLTSADPAQVLFRDDLTNPDRPQLRTDLNTGKHSPLDQRAAEQATKVAQKVQTCLKR